MHYVVYLCDGELIVYFLEDNLFTVMLYHGDSFSKGQHKIYEDGDTIYIDYFSTDTMFFIEMNAVLEDLKYDEIPMVYYHLEPRKDIGDGLVVLAEDAKIR